MLPEGERSWSWNAWGRERRKEEGGGEGKEGGGEGKEERGRERKRGGRGREKSDGEGLSYSDNIMIRTRTPS